MYSNIIGSTVDTLFIQSNMTCSCNTISDRKCSNKHKFMYQFSDATLMLSCGLLGHRKQLLKKCCNGIKANLYRYNYSYHEYDDFMKCVYTTIAVNIDNDCDVEYPMIDSKVKIGVIKKTLIDEIALEKEKEAQTRANITEICNMLEKLNEKLSLHKSAQNEMSKTLSYIKTHTVYQPSSLEPGKSNTLCPICHEDIDDSNSGKLYECSHAFHNDCIKEWFKNKDNISCPCCRKECEIDNYFIFSKQKN